MGRSSFINNWIFFGQAGRRQISCLPKKLAAESDFLEIFVVKPKSKEFFKIILAGALGCVFGNFIGAMIAHTIIFNDGFLGFAIFGAILAVPFAFVIGGIIGLVIYSIQNDQDKSMKFRLRLLIGAIPVSLLAVWYVADDSSMNDYWKTVAMFFIYGIISGACAGAATGLIDRPIGDSDEKFTRLDL